MVIIGVDPGLKESGVCIWDGEKPAAPFYSTNYEALLAVREFYDSCPKCILAVEKPVCQKWSGVEVSDTAVVAGMFVGVFICGTYHLITRSKIRWHIGKERKTNDKVVRARLIDRIYPAYDIHRDPGPLRGVTGDIWQALAVAVTCYDLIEKGDI